MHWVESMLFGMAERCAHGLWAACRLSEPLSFEVIAEQRKAALIDVLDQHGLPWTWETSEEDLEARLRQFSEQVYRQFLREASEELRRWTADHEGSRASDRRAREQVRAGAVARRG